MSYFSYTRNSTISLMFIFPFFLMYEILAYFLFDPSDYVIRNSADIIFRDIFEIITNNTLITYNGLLLILIFSFIFYNFKNKSPKFTLSYIFFMFIEGIFFGLLLVFILNGFSVFNYSQQNYFFIDYSFMFYSCLGAGIWEEILFRLLLFSFLYKIIRSFFKGQDVFVLFLSIILSSILFSLFHYIGNNADIFTLNTFLIRTFGGIFLGLLYYYRGFGIVVISHISYDFILVSLPLIYTN